MYGFIKLMLVFSLFVGLLNTKIYGEEISCSSDRDCYRAHCGPPQIIRGVPMWNCSPERPNCIEGKCVGWQDIETKIESGPLSKNRCFENAVPSVYAMSCLCLIAARTKDYSICQEIRDKYKKIDYFNWCTVDVAKATADISLCDKVEFTSSQGNVDLGWPKESCIRAVARANKNVAICNASRNKEYCIYGVGIETKDPKICYASGEKKNDCLYEIAVGTVNIKLCNEIDDKERKSRCMKFLQEMALEKTKTKINKEGRMTK